MKRIFNFKVLEGDSNKINKDEILVVRDNSTGKVKSIRERGNDGSLKELIPDNYIYCRVKSWITDLTDGDNISLLTLGDFIGPLISSSLVNYFLYSNLYAPFDVISYTDGEGISRYKEVKAIRIQKANLMASLDGNKVIKLESLKDLQSSLKLLGIEVDLSRALEPISKDEFDSMEIPTLPIHLG